MNAKTLQQYLDLWADACPTRDLGKLDNLTASDIHFIDPINDVTGRALLKRLFADAAQSVDQARVEIDAIAWVTEERAFVQWRYSGRLRRLGNRVWSAEGMSDIRFRDQLICYHRDYWDLAGGLFEYFPWIGGLFRRLRHRLRLRPD